MMNGSYEAHAEAKALLAPIVSFPNASPDGPTGKQAADAQEAYDQLVQLLDEVVGLRHLARLAGDVRDQLWGDVNWPSVPPWTKNTVDKLDAALGWFESLDSEPNRHV